jgi:MraZ protein
MVKNGYNGDTSGKKWVKVGDFMFMGEYHHSIDDKGRLTMPSKVRKDLGDEFIITRGLDDCLFVYQKDEWEKIIDKYRELPNTKASRNFMRIFLSGATTSSLDKNGRVNVPGLLIDYAGLEKDCVIIGVNDRLEIWSLNNWNNFMAKEEKEFSLIAEELFNN